jgi:cyclopropane fatty-acyl-phospholipid synthase-like methyltransferase
MGVSHAVYLACVKPYIRPDVTALEIGCGRGAWTRHMLGAKTVYCIDALSAEHNCFYEHVGRHEHVHYFKVSDFSLDVIPEHSLDYVFSYDTLCHVSLDGISEYAKNLYPRMRSGAVAFWMVADYDKYNAFVANLAHERVELRKRLVDEPVVHRCRSHHPSDESLEHQKVRTHAGGRSRQPPRQTLVRRERTALSTC